MIYEQYLCMYGLHVFTVYQSLNRAQERSNFICRIKFEFFRISTVWKMLKLSKMCLILITSYIALKLGTLVYVFKCITPKGVGTIMQIFSLLFRILTKYHYLYNFIMNVILQPSFIEKISKLYHSCADLGVRGVRIAAPPSLED